MVQSYEKGTMVRKGTKLRKRHEQGTKLRKRYEVTNMVRSYENGTKIFTKKKAREKPGMRRTYFRSGQFPDRASSGHVTDVTSGQKDPNMADMAPLPVAHAYMHARILPDKACA